MQGIPDGIDNLDVPFAVDELLDRLREPRRRIRLHARWHNYPDLYVKDRIRRSVEIAIMKGMEAEEILKHGEYAEDWQTSATMADRAAGSVLEFLKHLSGLGSKELAEKGERYLAQPLFSFHNYTTAKGNVLDMNNLSAADARALLRVSELLQQYGPYAAGRAKSLVQDRPNPGKPGKAAFVFTLAEAWIALTGRLPGKGADDNPFLWFVSTAWNDAGEAADEDFTHAMRQAIDDLSPRFSNGSEAQFMPDWLEGL